MAPPPHGGGIGWLRSNAESLLFGVTTTFSFSHMHCVNIEVLDVILGALESDHPHHHQRHHHHHHHHHHYSMPGLRACLLNFKLILQDRSSSSGIEACLAGYGFDFWFPPIFCFFTWYLVFSLFHGQVPAVTRATE